jgi:phosphoethanolamine N-methyltransferase
VSAREPQYSKDFVDRLGILWGEGFLSPGGPAEVKAILNGLSIADKSVLDIGCGTGGCEVVLVRDLNAGHIIAIDVETQMIERAQERALNAGISDGIEFRLVDPGPLDVANDSIDVVFSKDSMVHIEDKKELFSEILRVLKPGGVFAASDWLAGENTDNSPEWKQLRELAHLTFNFATAPEMEEVMREAGFEMVSTVDRNAWYKPITVEEVQQLEGPLKDRIIEVSDVDTYNHWLKVRKALRDSVAVGALRPTHLRGSKRAI